MRMRARMAVRRMDLRLRVTLCMTLRNVSYRTTTSNSCVWRGREGEGEGGRVREREGERG